MPRSPDVARLDRRTDVHRHVEETLPLAADLPVIDTSRDREVGTHEGLGGDARHVEEAAEREIRAQNVDVVVQLRAGAGPENGGMTAPRMRIELVEHHEIRVARIPAGVAFLPPAELERGTVARKFHVVDGVVAELAEEVLRVEVTGRQQRIADLDTLRPDGAACSDADLAIV